MQVHSDAIQQGLARVQSLLDGITEDDARHPTRFSQPSRRVQVPAIAYQCPELPVKQLRCACKPRNARTSGMAGLHV